MTRDDIIRMAQQAGFQRDMFGRGIWDSEDFNRFAALVAAAEREAMIKAGWRQCAEGQRTTQFCALLEEAVAKEREACAKVCEKFINDATDWDSGVWDQAADRCAAAIRARGDLCE